MKNKVIFITGGNAGIGLATALTFAKQGVNIAIFGRRKERNHEAKQQIEAEGVQCLVFAGDVGIDSDVEHAVNSTFDTFGRLDFAFNNAGLSQISGPLSEQTEKDVQEIMNTNVKGVWSCMRHEIPFMLKTGGGCIVNNSSAAGIVGLAGVPVYSASKHAVIGLTKSIALEYAKQNIRINAVCPASVYTELYDRFTGKDPEIEKAMEAIIPMGRVGDADEVASAVLYLCKDASWTTGQALVIDGGVTV